MPITRLQIAASNESALTKRGKSLPRPPGFVAEPEALPLSINERLQASKEGAAWQMAMSPGKALFQTAFMLWMSGSSIQIFSIYATGNALISPLRGMLQLSQAFKQFEEKDGINLFMPKLVFVSLQLLALGVALYKCSTMGLLPLTSADWTSYLPEKVYSEHALSKVV